MRFRVSLSTLAPLLRLSALLLLAAFPARVPVAAAQERVREPGGAAAAGNATSGEQPAADRGGDEPERNDRARERARMVQQIEDHGVRSPAVLEALRNVPRHLFVPERYSDLAYADQPLPIGEGQTISQPYIVAFMTEVLDLGPDDRILEVGTGSGYQAAVAAEIADSVFTVEIIEDLASSSAARLRRLGYRNVAARQADGYFGWEEHGPFDAIVVTAAAGHVPPPLVKQLRPGGRMVVPVGGVFQVQHLVLVSKDEEGQVTTRNLLPVRFVPLLGH